VNVHFGDSFFSVGLQGHPVGCEVHLFDSGFNPFLLSKHIFEEELVTLRPKEGDIFQDEFLFAFCNEVGIGFAHFFLFLTQDTRDLVFLIV
jgi:hypothetical protein